jgi:hypothetical protein
VGCSKVDLQVATLKLIADVYMRDGSKLKPVYAIDADGSRLLLFKLSLTYILLLSGSDLGSKKSCFKVTK